VAFDVLLTVHVPALFVVVAALVAALAVGAGVDVVAAAAGVEVVAAAAGVVVALGDVAAPPHAASRMLAAANGLAM